MLLINIGIETIDQELTPDGGEDEEAYRHGPTEEKWPAW